MQLTESLYNIFMRASPLCFNTLWYLLLPSKITTYNINN